MSNNTTGIERKMNDTARRIWKQALATEGFSVKLTRDQHIILVNTRTHTSTTISTKKGNWRCERDALSDARKCGLEIG